jgi:aminopeptidase N
VDLLLSEIPKELDVEARAGMWMSVWETFLHGDVPVTTLFDNILMSIDVETDPLLLEYIADKLSQTYWQFLLLEQRASISKDLDQRLFKRMMSVKDKSLKRTLFNVFSEVAQSPEGISNLKKLWTDEIAIGFDLSERDHIQLASALAIREVEGYAEILHTQLKRISNPDRVAEMEFVMPALSADPKERDLFFRKLAYKENLVREPWVLEGVRYLHHPLRQANSVQYVKKSLMMLEELQRTGDIFFPKGWLDATLGSYQSTEAADAVRAYLKENTGLRQDLRNKLLQSSDMLFRAEAITGKNRNLEPR